MTMAARIKKLRTTVVALHEDQNIYMVLDERNRSIGTGTKEVCEFLAELIAQPTRRRDRSRSLVQSIDNIRSAIRV